jgi:hypothetical protein
MDKNIKYFPLHIKKKKLDDKGILNLQDSWIITEKLDISMHYWQTIELHKKCWGIAPLFQTWALKVQYMISQLHAKATWTVDLPIVQEVAWIP